MPPDKLHCPALAIGALRDALSKWPGPQGKRRATDRYERRRHVNRERLFNHGDHRDHGGELVSEGMEFTIRSGYRAERRS